MNAPDRLRHLNLTWHEASRPDATIHYLDAGGVDPPVVFLHGLAGHAGEWTGTIEHLLSGWRTLALDQRGHGRSTRTPIDVSREAFVDDVAAVIQAAKVDRPAVLIGQSMGAHTALLAAARYPYLVSHLVMIEGDVGGGGEEEISALRAALASWPVPFPDLSSARAFFGGNNERGHAWVGGFDQRADGLWPRWELEVMIRTMEPIFAREYWSDWESLTHPTLLVLGQNGSIDKSKVARMLATRPETRQVTIASAGHDVHLDQPETWLQALDEFLA